MSYPTLNANVVFGTLYNQIISIQNHVNEMSFDPSLDIVKSRKVDGTLYGDTKVYRDTDVLRSYDWSHKDATYNLLTHMDPPAPKEDYVVIDTYRQIPVTISEYLVKQAWTEEGAFSQFNSLILGWMGKTRAVYEHTKFTADIYQAGLAGATSIGTIAIPAASAGTTEDGKVVSVTELDIKLRYQVFARKLRTILKGLNEPSRLYNNNGFLKNINPSELQLILPLGIKDEFEQFGVELPMEVKEVDWKYPGVLLATAGTSNGTVRSAVETQIVDANGDDVAYVFSGDLIPSGGVYKANEAYTPTFTAAPSLLTSDLTFLILHKSDFPIPSAFSVNTSFFNAKDLVISHYMTWGYSNPRNNHLNQYPLLKVSTDVAV